MWQTISTVRLLKAWHKTSCRLVHSSPVNRYWINSQIILQSPHTTLNFPEINAVQWTVGGLWKMSEFPLITWSHTAFQHTKNQVQFVFIWTRQLHTCKHQPTVGHAPYPTNSPTATSWGGSCICLTYSKIPGSDYFNPSHYAISTASLSHPLRIIPSAAWGHRAWGHRWPESSLGGHVLHKCVRIDRD